MRSWKVIRLLLLPIVVGGLLWTLHSRGLLSRLGSTTAAVETEYSTEHQWAVLQTARDIEQIAALAHRREPRHSTSMLPDAPWDVDAFAPLAERALGDATPASAADEPALDIYPALTALDAQALVDAGGIVTKALVANMRNARAHESAALVVGAFALREAADQFSDVRWALNRMTAHLAVARALRAGEGGSPDGALAIVILSALSNHHERAAGELAALGSGMPPEPLHAWVRALQLRLTQDWRTLPEPSQATRLEKLEYFRARRAAVRRQQAAAELERIGEDVAADFARIAQDSGVGVADGRVFVDPALELELDEAADVYRRAHGRPMSATLPEALNQRATGLVDASSVQVLPWGAWAEFFQRHIAMNIGRVDSFHRYFLGDAEGAESAKAELDRRLGELTLFPVGTLRRTKGTAATEADMTHVSRVVDLAVSAPELVSYRAWWFFEYGSKAESVPRSMPKLADWFPAPSATTPFEAGVRQNEGKRVSGTPLDAIISAASADVLLLTTSAVGAAKDPVAGHAQRLLQKRYDYDLRAIDAALKPLTKIADWPERAALLQKACAISPRDCADLGLALRWLEREEEAATAYERGFADPSIDSVALSADAGWLVNYYYRNKRADEALALADRAAMSGSWNGMTIRGRLLERLGRLDEAELEIGTAATQYKSYEQLLGFYYRRVDVDRNATYEPRWQRWLAEVFPDGLQPESSTMTSTPKSGVFVYKDSEVSRQAGIRAGDIIIGLEGWRVDTFEQYRAINAMKDDDPGVQLTLWRGALIKIDTQMPGRLFGTDIRTHPMKGWIQ